MSKEIKIKGETALELNKGQVHYVEINKEWYSVNGSHFDGHLGGIRWQVNLESPSGAEDKELVAYLETEREPTMHERNIAQSNSPFLKDTNHKPAEYVGRFRI